MATQLQLIDLRVSYHIKTNIITAGEGIQRLVPYHYQNHHHHRLHFCDFTTMSVSDNIQVQSVGLQIL